MKSHFKDNLFEIFPRERDEVDIISKTEIGNVKLLGVERKGEMEVELPEEQIVNKKGIFMILLAW